MSAPQQLLLAGAGVPAFALVNTVHGYDPASATTLALSALSLTAGNHIFVHARWETLANTITGVTDTAGNVYFPLTRVNAVNLVLSQWWYALNATGNASNVVTVTWSTATTFRWVTSLQFSSSIASFDLEETTGVANSLSTVTSGSFTTACAGLILAGRGAYSAQTSSSFNQSLTWVDPLTDTTLNYGSVGYRVTNGATGPLTVTETGNASSHRALAIACFGNQLLPRYRFINSVHGFSTASATTIALPALSLTAGNNIFVHVRWENTNTITGVTDTAGNTYTPLTRLAGTGPVISQWFYKLNAAGHASNVVTVTFSAATDWRWATSLQFASTLAAAFDVEQATGISAASTTVTSGSFSTTAAGLILAGRSCYNAQTSSSFNQSLTWVSPITDTTQNFGSVGYRLTSGAVGPITVTETGSGSTNRALCIACFK